MKTAHVLYTFEDQCIARAIAQVFLPFGVHFGLVDIASNFVLPPKGEVVLIIWSSHCGITEHKDLCDELLLESKDKTGRNLLFLEIGSSEQAFLAHLQKDGATRLALDQIIPGILMPTNSGFVPSESTLKYLYEIVKSSEDHAAR